MGREHGTPPRTDVVGHVVPERMVKELVAQDGYAVDARAAEMSCVWSLPA